MPDVLDGVRCCGASAAMFVGFFRGLLDFLVGVRQQLLGLGGVTAHIEFIGLLGGVDAADGLIDQSLCSSEVGVAVGTHVLSDCDTTGDECERQGSAEG